MNAVNSAILLNNDDLMAFLTQLKSLAVFGKFRFRCSIQKKEVVFLGEKSLYTQIVFNFVHYLLLLARVRPQIKRPTQ